MRSGGGGEELLSLESENTSDFERQNTVGRAMSSSPAIEKNDVTYEKMIMFEPRLEASGERNLRSINVTHWECPCHCWHRQCGIRTVWHSNLCMIWDVEEIRSVGLPFLW